MKNLFLLVLCVLTSPLLAQENPLDYAARAVPVRFIAPDILAFWLDPAHNPEPKLLATARDLKGEKAPPEKPTFELSAGVKGVFALSKEQQLLVVGTREAIENAESIIQDLDRKPRNLKIEARWVEVRESDSRSFGIDFGKPRATTQNAPIVGVVRGNFGATLRALQSRERAKILAASPLVAHNNFAAGVFTPNPPGEGATLHFVVTPTLNRDNTMTLQLQSLGASKTFSIAQLRDGETLAFANFGTPPLQKSQEANLVLLFITAQILPQDDEIPGT